MKEQFDKKLVEKIKSSFSNHEEPFDPTQWEKFSSAYFKSRRPLWQVYWPIIATGIAASLLLVFLYVPLGIERNSRNTAIVDTSSLPEAEITPRDFNSNDDSMALQEETNSAESTEKIGDSRAKSKYPHLPSDAVVKREPNNDGRKSPIQNQEQLDPFKEQQPQTELPVLGINENLAEDAAIQPTVPTTKSMNQSEALDRVNEWLAENESSLPVTPKKERSGPLKLGVMVSPQASSNGSGEMNLGAGIMSEISLTRRLKLDVGVNYARQSMMPDRSPSMAMEMATFSSSSQNMDVQNIRTSSNFIGSEMRLNFASLDIPVNLKYRVMNRKNTGLFLITGLSSMVYLDQQATETFETNSFFTTSAEGLSFAPSVQKFTSVYAPEGGGNSVDVGGMLNLSVGYEYNLNDGMFISLEPFYKLPLGNLTFANQQFSIGGLNLRMNFKIGK